jgi:hypothetical protein
MKREYLYRVFYLKRLKLYVIYCTKRRMELHQSIFCEVKALQGECIISMEHAIQSGYKIYI